LGGAIDVAFQTGLDEFRGELIGLECGETGSGSVGEDYVEGKDVIDSLAVDGGVASTRVVADTSADSGTAGSGGVDGVMETVRAEDGVELGKNDAWLYAGPLPGCVDFDDAVHVGGEVKDDSVVDGLASEAGAGAAREDGEAVPGGDAHDVLHVGGGARGHDGDGLHLVDGGVGGVEEAGGAVDFDVLIAAYETGG